MKIPDTANGSQFKENEDLLKRMNKGLERKIASKEFEIKEVDKIYDKKVAQAKLQGEEELAVNIERNQNRIVGESNLFEEKIQSYQEQLKKAQDSVAKEESSIKGAHKDKISDLKTQLEENFQDQYMNKTEEQREIQSSTQNAVKEIATKSKAEKLDIENKAQYEINALSSGFNQKTADSEKEFRNKLTNDVRLHTAEVKQQRDELKKVMDTDAEKNKRLSSEKNRVNQEQLNFQDKYQQNMLTQRDQDFKVRYEKMVKEHDSILKELSTRFEADVKKMVDQTSADKKIIAGRVEDPFYRVDKLTPKMVEEPKIVTVSMPVAEYEKENVHLSAQGRNIKITLSRKYTDSVASADGSLNRSTRSELYSKELNTVDLLNPREITQSYEDGILSFKIKKA